MKNKILNIIKIAVIIELLVALLNFNLTTIFLSLFTLSLLFLTDYIKKKLEFPYKLQLLIYIFIIGTEVLGEIHNLYNKVWYYDDIMHTLSSFIVAALSIYILNKITKDNNKKLVVVVEYVETVEMWKLVRNCLLFSPHCSFWENVKKWNVLVSFWKVESVWSGKEKFEHTISRADGYLYEAKERGKDQYVGDM